MDKLVFGFRLDEDETKFNEEVSKIFMTNLNCNFPLREKIENRETIKVASFPKKGTDMEERAELVLVNVKGSWIIGATVKAEEVWYRHLKNLYELMRDWFARNRCSAIFFSKEETVSLFRL